MAYVIGIVLGLATCLFAKLVRLDRDRAFYPTLLVAIASYYVLFAVMAGSSRAILLDSLIMGVFLITAALGFTKNLWLVAVALAAHGALDMVHHLVVANPGVPAWWPAFCMTFDIAAAAFLAWLLLRPNSMLRPQAVTSARRL